MNKSIFAVCIAVLLIAIVFSGCFESNSHDQKKSFKLTDESRKFFGTWINSTLNETYVFYSNGTYIKDFNPQISNNYSFHDEGTYYVDDNQNLFLYEKNGLISEQQYWYHFKNDNTTLGLYDTKFGSRYINLDTVYYSKQ